MKFKITCVVVVFQVLFSLLTYTVFKKVDINFYIDGEKKIITSNLRSTSKLIETTMDDIEIDDYIIVNDEELTADVKKDMDIYVQTKKEVTVVIAEEASLVTTYGLNVADLAEDLELSWGIAENPDQYFITDVSEDTAITDGDRFDFKLAEVLIIEEEDIGAQDIEKVYVSTLKLNEQQIVQQGQPQIVNRTYVVTLQDGVEVGREIIEEVIVQEAIVHKIAIGTKKVTTAKTTTTATQTGSTSAEPTMAIWDSIAKCESGGNWSINTGNGYYGGLQFSASSWTNASKAVGLDIDYAHLATKDEQILAATWLQSRSGWRAWGSCSKKLGLY